MASLICYIYLSVSPCTSVWTDPSLRYTSMLLGSCCILVGYRPSNMLVYLRDRMLIVPATCCCINNMLDYLRDRLVIVPVLLHQRHAGLSQGQVGSRPSNMLVYLRDRSAHGNSMCCHTQTEDADQTCYLTQSQYTDTRPTIPSTDPITPAAWQGRHQSNNS